MELWSVGVMWVGSGEAPDRPDSGNEETGRCVGILRLTSKNVPSRGHAFATARRVLDVRRSLEAKRGWTLP